MKSFGDFPLSEEILNSLDKIGFVKPTPIQVAAIPLLLKGQDVIARAETGSGKTAAFAIPLVEHLGKNKKAKALVLAPTRELAQQIEGFFNQLLPQEGPHTVVGIYGGVDIRKQFKKLQRPYSIIVATPGRLIDHLRRNTLQVSKCQFVVIDEGDRMLDMGFGPQLKEIQKGLPKTRLTSFFTATWEKSVTRLAQSYLRQPKTVYLTKPSSTVSTITQSVLSVNKEDKEDILMDELNRRQGSILVFVKTKHETHNLFKHLKEFGFQVEEIHGDCTQGQRNKAMAQFKSEQVKILCATDVAARGLDIQSVQHVINFDLPVNSEDYLHRIGRTGRNGAKGESVTFVTREEYGKWNRIANKFKLEMLGASEGKK